MRPGLTATALLLALLPAAPRANAAGGDFANTDFAAAAPFTYNRLTGGGAYNDRTVGDYKDVTEQLEGAQFTCGDVVSYLTQIELEATTVDPVQTVEFDFSFLADSTGQSGAAHSQVLGVAINYGQVENGDDGTGVNPGAGFFGLDSGIADDGGSTATLLTQYLTGPLFQAGSELRATVQVDDLEAGEKVVVRIDTLLVCDPGSSPTGNLQGQLNAGRVLFPASDTLNTGEQTIPFLRVGDIAGAGEPLLQLVKTVTVAGGACGVDDVDQLQVFAGDTVKYCYTLVNPGTADLYDVEVIDDAGSPGDPADDFTVSCSLPDLDGQADLGDLAPGASVVCEALVTFEFAATVTNVAEATGNNGLSGGNYRELNASDSATVVVEGVPNSPPVAADDSATTDEDTAVVINAAANDSEVDGNLDPSSASVVTGPSNGTVASNGDGTFTYTPNENFFGTDSFVYQICDTEGLCDTATVTITVNPQNDPPVAVDDAVAVDEDTPVSFNVLGNDSDPDGPEDLDPSSVTVVSGTSNGQLFDDGNGNFTYVPDENFFGTDTFTYEVCDLAGECDSAVVVIIVNPVNDPPVALDNAYTTEQDVTLTVGVGDGVLLRDEGDGIDYDVDGDAIFVSSFDAISAFGGTVWVHSDGSFDYTPAPGFAGYDAFTYTISDGNGGFDTATVTITVNAKNGRSISVDFHDWTLSGDLLAGDFLITNQSGPYDVQITSLEILVQYRTSGPGRKQWIDVAVTDCSFAPEPFFLVSDQAWVGFDGCQLAASIPSGSTVRVTAVVGIFGHKDRGHQKQFFLDRLSKAL